MSLMSIESMIINDTMTNIDYGSNEGITLSFQGFKNLSIETKDAFIQYANSKIDKIKTLHEARQQQNNITNPQISDLISDISKQLLNKPIEEIEQSLLILEIPKSRINALLKDNQIIFCNQEQDIINLVKDSFEQESNTERNYGVFCIFTAPSVVALSTSFSGVSNIVCGALTAASAIIISSTVYLDITAKKQKQINRLLTLNTSVEELI